MNKAFAVVSDWVMSMVVRSCARSMDCRAKPKPARLSAMFLSISWRRAEPVTKSMEPTK